MPPLATRSAVRHGDSLTAEADALAAAAGIGRRPSPRLQVAGGLRSDQNADAETIADVHVSPVELAAAMLPFGV